MNFTLHKCFARGLRRVNKDVKDMLSTLFSPVVCGPFLSAIDRASNDNLSPGGSDKAKAIHRVIFSACLKAAFL